MIGGGLSIYGLRVPYLGATVFSGIVMVLTYTSLQEPKCLLMKKVDDNVRHHNNKDDVMSGIDGAIRKENRDDEEADIDDENGDPLSPLPFTSLSLLDNRPPLI